MAIRVTARSDRPLLNDFSKRKSAIKKLVRTAMPRELAGLPDIFQVRPITILLSKMLGPGSEVPTSKKGVPASKLNDPDSENNISSVIKDHINRGNDLFRKGRYDEAKIAYNNAITLIGKSGTESLNIIASFNLALAHIQLKENEKAIYSLLSIIDLKEVDKNAVNLALGKAYFADGNLSKAKETFDLVGHMSHKMRDSESDVEMFLKILGPDHMPVAIEHTKDGLIKPNGEPEQFGTTGMTADEIDGIAHVGLYEEKGGPYSRSGWMSDFYGSLVQNDIKKGYSYSVLAENVYKFNENYQIALTSYRKALKERKLSTDDKEFFVSMLGKIAMRHFKNDSFAIALSLCLEALEIKQNAILLVNIGQIYDEFKNYLESVKYYQKALKLDLKYIRAYYHLGKDYLRLANNYDTYYHSRFAQKYLKEAKKYFETALKLDHDKASDYYEFAVDSLEKINKLVK